MRCVTHFSGVASAAEQNIAMMYAIEKRKYIVGDRGQDEVLS